MGAPFRPRVAPYLGRNERGRSTPSRGESVARSLLAQFDRRERPRRTLRGQPAAAGLPSPSHAHPLGLSLTSARAPPRPQLVNKDVWSSLLSGEGDSSLTLSDANSFNLLGGTKRPRVSTVSSYGARPPRPIGPPGSASSGSPLLSRRARGPIQPPRKPAQPTVWHAVTSSTALLCSALTQARRSTSLP